MKNFLLSIIILLNLNIVLYGEDNYLCILTIDDKTFYHGCVISNSFEDKNIKILTVRGIFDNYISDPLHYTNNIKIKAYWPNKLVAEGELIRKNQELALCNFKCETSLIKPAIIAANTENLKIIKYNLNITEYRFDGGYIGEKKDFKLINISDFKSEPSLIEYNTNRYDLYTDFPTQVRGGIVINNKGELVSIFDKNNNTRTKPVLCQHCQQNYHFYLRGSMSFYAPNLSYIKKFLNEE